MVGTVVVRGAEGNAPSAPTVVRPETDHVVQMTPDSFVPETLTVEVGASVGWVNGTGIAHSVTASEGRIPDEAAYFASGGFENEDAARADWEGPREGDVTHDQPYTHTFETPGEYDYFCILHEESMRGTVRVTD
ncbi:halocyanin [Halomarina oriensis]|uniref:Halocyanin n=2 Tax=Halomarina oriensis TaxID=671145 RepID=A0A6B0GM37_9EURY|nr:plastocyanin/azurin family copper-binding protein [Halomarina oriensis]MWG35956.1 halocyanin [Halomarina oriensis]